MPSHSSIKRSEMRHSLHIIFIFLYTTQCVESLVPSCSIKIENEKVYAAQASFGESLPSRAHSLDVNLVKPLGYQDGCKPKISASIVNMEFALLVQRSPNCTFSDRAIAAQKIGASALVVQNSIEGIYRNRSFAENKVDYDCDNGMSWISNYKDINVKYSGFQDSACALSAQCASSRCLLTSDVDPSTNMHKICCAWDSYISMATSSVEHSFKIDIPSVFVKMTDVDTMSTQSNFFSMSSLASPYVPISLYSRYESWINYSSLLLWLLGVFTATYASWYSCDSLRTKYNHHAYDLLKNTHITAPTSEDHNELESLELNLWHAIGFICIASLMLIVLFFFDLYLAVIIVYCISASTTTGLVMFRTPCLKILGSYRANRVVMKENEYLGEVLVVDVVSTCIAFVLSLIWFLSRNSSPYAFILQDVFGICLCILFLQVIKLPNLRVAALLLTLAFFYDVFFVFISPLFFSESVMVRVASGNEPTQDPNYCEHYPTDDGCSSNQLPMLLLLPKVNDYEGGYVLLGLGDIVLPGLLLAFGARFDATSHSMNHSRFPRHWLLLVIGYAVGLGMANMAVYAMNTGQPALLYLVPCTLGVLCIYTRHDGTFNEMWEGINSDVLTRDDMMLGQLHGEGISDDIHDKGEDISDHCHGKFKQHHSSSPRSSNNSAGGYGGINVPEAVLHDENEDMFIEV